MKGTALGDSLAKALRSESSLGVVGLSDLEVGQDVAQQLMEALAKASSLHNLRVRSVLGLGAAFPASMPGLSHLEVFSYEGGSLADAQGVLQAFRANPPRRATFFTFANTPGWPGKGKAIFELLEQMPDLRGAVLEKNELGTEDLMPVLKTMTLPPKLTQISVESNRLNNDVVELIQKACMSCHEVDELELDLG